MTRPLILLAVAISALLDDCAAAPSRTPVQFDSPASPDTAYLALTRYEACQREASSFSPASRSAVVRYYNTPTDSVRHPFRIITGSTTGLCSPMAMALGPNGELFVLNQAPEDLRQDSAAGRWQRWVTVYDSSAGGDIAPIRVLHVQSTWLGHPSTMHVDREGALYLGSRGNDVIDEGSVAVFDADADGDAEPLRMIAGPGTGLFRPAAIGLDRRGFVYVLNSQDGPFAMKRGMARTFAGFTQSTAPWARAALDPDAVRVFAPGAAGDVAPSRQIGGERTGLNDPVSLALDGKDRLYVANSASVTMYLPSASGDAAPARRFTDSRVYGRMGAPTSVLLDSHDSLFVGSGGEFDSPRSLAVFAPADSTVPSRSFFRNVPAMFALDRHDTLYALAGDTVKVLAPGYAGGASPVRAIAGPHTGIRSVTAMALDRLGRLYLAVGDSAIVRVYDPGVSGDVAPVRTIAGLHTRLTRPRGIAVDGNGELYITNGQRRGGGGAIRVYAAGARGEDQPVRTIVAPDVTLLPPSDIVSDDRGDLYVAASNETTSGQVLVRHGRGQRADSAVRILGGPSTLLRRPIALAIGPGDTLYALNVFGAYATVTIFAPGAGGDAEPVRVIEVLRKGENPALETPLAAMRTLAADDTGAVQVWTSDGAVVYPPSAGGAAPPARVTLEKAVEGERGAVTVAGDGTVYQAIGPMRYDRFLGGSGPLMLER